MEGKPFYIYRHIRPDTNEVFYIGKGNNLDKRKSLYRRAYEVVKRNKFWKNIYYKNNRNIIIEIIFHCKSHAEANVKEMEFIILYGRRDCGKGSLVNMTDGGDGSLGVLVSDEVRRKKRELGSPMKGKRHTIATKEKLSIAAKNRTTPNAFLGKHHKIETIEKLRVYAKNRTYHHTHKVIDTLTGTIYNSVKDAALAISMNKKNLSSCLSGKRKNKTTLRYL